jgi:LPXTG-motif cell wall-anchored protein
VPTVATTMASSGATASGASSATTAGSTTTLAPNGLGQIATDLGRWTRSNGPGAWALTAGAGAALGAAGLLTRRRRRRTSVHAGDGNSHHAN